jgi:hypothetical protein
MSNTSCHGHKNMKMNNEMIDLNLNPNKKYRNQEKITRGLRQEHEMCKQKFKQIFIVTKHANSNTNLP